MSLGRRAVTDGGLAGVVGFGVPSVLAAFRGLAAGDGCVWHSWRLWPAAVVGWPLVAGGSEVVGLGRVFSGVAAGLFGLFLFLLLSSGESWCLVFLVLSCFLTCVVVCSVMFLFIFLDVKWFLYG